MRADISQFYSSIYTHSLPWALHTKAVAKKNKSNYGDDLDAAFRKMMHGQTSGIPIGPDASLIAAEILLTAVDAELARRVDLSHGFRYIDDYEFGFTSIGKAEDALVILEGLMTEYELRLNPAKTTIVEAPEPFQELWVSDLMTYPIRTGSATTTINDVLAFFSHAAGMARANPRHAVLRYALARARGFPIQARGWRTFEGLVLSTVSAEPTAFPVAIDLLWTHSTKVGVGVGRAALSDVIESQIARHAPLRNASEVAWALWAALQFNVRLTATAAKAVSDIEDDVVALLALDARARHLFPAGTLDTSTWRSLLSDADVLSSEHWLLAYEADGHGWLRAAGPRIAAHSFFRELKSDDVRFYDRGKRRRPFTGPAAPVPGGQLRTFSL